LKLQDPDGGTGTQVFETRTPPLPAQTSDARITKAGLGGLNNALPGDVVLLTDGEYGEIRFIKDGQPPFLSDPGKLQGAADLKLKPTSLAVDAGLVLPNVNDG